MASGDIMYHAYVNKTAEEIWEFKAHKEDEAALTMNLSLVFDWSCVIMHLNFNTHFSFLYKHRTEGEKSKKPMSKRNVWPRNRRRPNAMLEKRRGKEEEAMARLRNQSTADVMMTVVMI